MDKGRVQKKKYGNFHKSRNALKKIYWRGVPPKTNPKGPPFGYFGKILKKSPIKKNPKDI